MKITILENSTIKHNGYVLTAYQTYNDIDEVTCRELIASGDAKEAKDEIQGVSYTSTEPAPKTPKFDVEANGGYVAEAVIPEEKKRKLKNEGKLNDTTPVVGEDKTLKKDETPEPVITTEVLGPDGKPLTDEQIAEKEASSKVSGVKENETPTVGEAQNSGTSI